GLLSLEGDLAPGGKIKLVSGMAPDRTFKLKVSAFEPPNRMVWSAGNPVIFKGVRESLITPNGDGSTFQMTETFAGLFSRPILKAVPEQKPWFDRFADALKKECEP
ncbi:MAG: hypothetical protein AAGF49_05200, partial [Pseudomonadota bacterium]